MPTNIEIKARVNDFEKLKATIERLSDAAAEILDQEDTFFDVPSGRLKLRFFSPDRGELIYYQRGDRQEPKPSFYLISRTNEPDSLRAVLSRALAVRGVVKKTRLVYLIGQTRVHLDEVAGLGQFVELEVIMQPNQSAEDGQTIAHELMQRFGIAERDLLSGAYIDLMKRKNFDQGGVVR
jgi:adenylate cyclase class IV